MYEFFIAQVNSGMSNKMARFIGTDKKNKVSSFQVIFNGNNFTIPGLFLGIMRQPDTIFNENRNKQSRTIHALRPGSAHTMRNSQKLPGCFNDPVGTGITGIQIFLRTRIKKISELRTFCTGFNIIKYRS